ncbi:transglutaminase family protein [Caulobacter sp. SLTY]|uniref:transglutaminase family protein n=1 Tax=Caulobacter sp. SLTY TaxID=2683262 RepID=UPI001411C6D0|nr:transglutaminase family protein [Caulobacter sp. SLTY]NBB16322.1 transglutaminase family protein [Caulobacter sp. SLTY]
MKLVSICHRTTYRYGKPVAFGEHRMMLRPLQAFDQQIVSSDLTISPEPSLLRHIQDAAGACVGVARFEGLSDTLTFESKVRLNHIVADPLDLEDASALVGQPFYDPEEQPELAASLRRRHADEGQVEAFAKSFLHGHGATRVSSLLSDMTHAIRADFAYALRLHGAPQTPAETLALRTGSCRDFAVLMMEAARSLGLAARFVSGYVYSGSAKAGRTGGGHTHAWTRVFVPGCGWVDFDPTNGIVGNTDLIRVAVVSDPRMALPLYGSYDGEPEDALGMDVAVDISVESEAEVQPLPFLRVARAG